MYEDDILVLIGIGAIVMGFIGRYVSKSKNRSGWEGFLFGFFLSILGIIIAALLPTIKKEKPAELTADEKEQMELKAKELKQKADEMNRKTAYVRNIVLLVVFLMIVFAYLSRTL
jgi:CDP-diglyceride synthetase